MSLAEQAVARVTLARSKGRQPVRWVATALAAAEAGADEALVGLPVEIGMPRSGWGLDLVCAPPPLPAQAGAKLPAAT